MLHWGWVEQLPSRSKERIMGWRILGRWIFCRTVGDKVTTEIIRRYIRYHKEEEKISEQLKLF
jgi:hypothetical protein